MVRRARALVACMVLGAVLVGFSTPARAAEDKVCPICGKTSANPSYATKAGCTLVRGATNTLFGWTELFRQPAKTAQEGGNVFVGLAQGVGQTIKRTLEGAGEVLTFWTPKVQDHYIQFASDCPLCMGKHKQ